MESVPTYYLKVGESFQIRWASEEEPPISFDADWSGVGYVLDSDGVTVYTAALTKADMEDPDITDGYMVFLVSDTVTAGFPVGSYKIVVVISNSTINFKKEFHYQLEVASSWVP